MPSSLFLFIYNFPQPDRNVPAERAGPAHEETELAILRIDPEMCVVVARPAEDALGNVPFVNRRIIQHK